MAHQDDLFGGAITPEPSRVEPASADSAGVRRTKRQRADVVAGRHPLTGGTLNPQAPTDATNEAAPGLRCGSCIHRIHRGNSNATWPKCNAFGPTYMTHGGATDVRAWWPACGTHQPTPPGRTTTQ